MELKIVKTLLNPAETLYRLCAEWACPRRIGKRGKIGKNKVVFNSRGKK